MVTQLFESSGYLSGDSLQRFALLILFSISSDSRQVRISLKTLSELIAVEIDAVAEALEGLIQSRAVAVLDAEKDGLVLQLMEVNVL